MAIASHHSPISLQNSVKKSTEQAFQSHVPTMIALQESNTNIIFQHKDRPMVAMLFRSGHQRLGTLGEKSPWTSPRGREIE